MDEVEYRLYKKSKEAGLEYFLEVFLQRKETKNSYCGFSNFLNKPIYYRQSLQNISSDKKISFNMASNEITLNINDTNIFFKLSIIVNSMTDFKY